MARRRRDLTVEPSSATVADAALERAAGRVAVMLPMDVSVDSPEFRSAFALRVAHESLAGSDLSAGERLEALLAKAEEVGCGRAARDLAERELVAWRSGEEGRDGAA